ncbi:MAG TPA: HNH endonuclease [Tissierellaceae bacterium]|nr:HNH endonuclease [Tissierellaceae bacterium]
MKKKFISEIKGFERCNNHIIYEDGRVFSLYTKDFMKTSIDSKGYNYIDLRSCNPIIKNPKVHRLVMLAFSSDKPKEQINHKDGIKGNNHISNLEWCTNRENRIHAIKNGLLDNTTYGVGQYDLNHKLLRIFDTAADAMIYLGKDPNLSGAIGRVIKGKRATAYGYIWKQYDIGSTTIPGGGVHSSEWKQREP